MYLLITKYPSIPLRMVNYPANVLLKHIGEFTRCTYFQMASSLEKLETQLEMFTENVRQLGIIVSDFQPQGQSVFNQKMQG